MVRDAGVSAEIVISPLLRIEQITPDVLPEAEAMIFTSVHGVAGYAAVGGQAGKPALCVGEATAKAARDAGFDVELATPDAARLKPKLAGETRKLLHARGAHVAADLTGVATDCESVVVYDQIAQNLSAQARDLLHSGRPVVVPLFSPRSAALFADEAGGAKGLIGIFISEAAAHKAADVPWVRKVTAEMPDAETMLRLCVTELQVR